MQDRTNIISSIFPGTKENLKATVIDLLILSGVYALVSWSHLIPFPLYKLEPMKLLLLVAIIFSTRGNAFLMAATIPLTSTLVSGHPVFPKNLIIGVELMVFAGILTASRMERYQVPFRFMAALLASKFIYYVVKAVVIYFGWLQMSLFSSDFTTQVQGGVIVFAIYWLLISYQRRQA